MSNARPLPSATHAGVRGTCLGHRLDRLHRLCIGGRVLKVVQLDAPLLLVGLLPLYERGTLDLAGVEALHWLREHRLGVGPRGERRGDRHAGHALDERAPGRRRAAGDDERAAGRKQSQRESCEGRGAPHFNLVVVRRKFRVGDDTSAGRHTEERGP